MLNPIRATNPKYEAPSPPALRVVPARGATTQRVPATPHIWGVAENSVPASLLEILRVESGNARRVVVWSYDAQAQAVAVEAVVGRTEADNPTLETVFADASSALLPFHLLAQTREWQRMVKGLKPVILGGGRARAGVRADYIRYSDPAHEEEWLAREQAGRGVLLLPLTWRSKLFGFLSIHCYEGTPSQSRRLSLLQSLTETLAIALMSADEADDASPEAVTHAIGEAVGEAQQRIARDLHDTVVQDATVAMLQLENARGTLNSARQAEIISTISMDEAFRSVVLASQSVRRLIEELRDAIWVLRAGNRSVPDMYLPAAALACAQHVLSRQGGSLPFEIETLGEERPIPGDQVEHILRILTEALHNTACHARAKHVWITLRFGGDSLSLIVDDDGRGFEVSRTPGARREGGFGLLGMRERAAILGGHVEVTSKPGHGTRVHLSVPLGES